MINFGAVPSGAVLPVIFDSFDGGTGASITLTGLIVGDVEIYKGTSMTQRASDAGVVLLDTDGIDIDTITGIHGFSIDTGDNTDAGFYAVGSFFTVVVSAVTIDAQTVNFVAATFRLVAAESVTGVPEVDLTHVAGSTSNVSALAANVDAILTDTADMQPKLGTPAGASISADLLVIDNFVDGLETTIGAAGAGLTAVPWNAAWDAEVQSEVDDALVAQRLDELLNADSDIDGVAPPTVGSVVHELLSKTAGSFTYDQTTDSLEAIRDKETDIETDTAEIGAAGAGLTTRASQASVDDLPTNTELATSQAAADDATLAAIAALNNLSAAQVNAEVDTALDDTIADSIPADGTRPSVRQALYLLTQFMLERSVASTTVTVKKPDGTTALFTLTLNDATTPTSITRAT